MPDDSLDMPEFDKPENIPLIVPDLTVPAKKPRKMRADHCAGNKKDGSPCGFAKQKGKDFCIQHDPAISADQKQAWRKVPRKPRILPMGVQKANYYTREEILEILSKRIKVWMDKFGEMLNPDVDEAICDLCRTYAVVAKVEVSEAAGEVRGWRMKGSA